MRNLRVLIAEEKDIVAARLAAQLRGLGHRVLGIVRDGHAAVASAWRTQPDLILLDQHLPPRGGIEAGRVILTKHSVPLILLIGYPAADLVQRAQEAGVLAYLVWPADAKALGTAIGVAQTRFRELKVLHEQAGDLQHALRSRAMIERAKKLLMQRLELAEADTFAYMYRQSRSTRTPLGEVAAGLLTAGEVLFGKSDLIGCVDIILEVLTGRQVLGPQQLG